jgi:hypothetical protein
MPHVQKALHAEKARILKSICMTAKDAAFWLQRLSIIYHGFTA